MGAFIAASLALWIAALASDQPFQHGASWTRFDSLNYLSIARHGYEISACGPGTGLGPSESCGNAGWFGGYSLVVRAVHELGLSLAGGAVLVSAVFSLATLMLLWQGFMGAEPTARNLSALAIAAFIPGLVYTRAVFPFAMSQFLVLGSIYLAGRRRWLSAGAVGLAAATTHPVVVVLAPALALWAMVDRQVAWRERLRGAALSAGPTAAGFALVLAVQAVQTGVWGAFFKVQQSLGPRSSDPVSSLIDSVRALVNGAGGLAAVPHLQALAVAAAMIALFFYAARHRARIEPVESLALTFAALVWLVPMFAEQARVPLARFRYDTLLIPAVLLGRRMPVGYQLAVLAVVAALSVPLAMGFFQRVLV